MQLLEQVPGPIGDISSDMSISLTLPYSHALAS